MKMRASFAIVLSLLSTASSSVLAIDNENIAGGLSERDASLDNWKRSPVINRVFPTDHSRPSSDAPLSIGRKGM